LAGNRDTCSGVVVPQRPEQQVIGVQRHDASLRTVWTELNRAFEC
jgi:hypothetical protein